MAESNYQRKLKQDAERIGWTVIKLVRATVNGYPDLVLLHPTWGIMFIEVKDVKGRLSKLQEYRIQELNTKGFAAIVADPSNHAETIAAITPHLPTTKTNQTAKK